MLRNIASGPEIGLPGRVLAGLLPGQHRNRPSGRPSAGRMADFGAFPVAVRLKSGPEGRSAARKHCCEHSITSHDLCIMAARCFLRCGAEVHPGDVVYVPAGYIFVERYLNADVIALRVFTPTIGSPAVARALKWATAHRQDVGVRCCNSLVV